MRRGGAPPEESGYYGQDVSDAAFCRVLCQLMPDNGYHTG